MSLPESVIDSWLKTHATDDSYPVHEVKEGAEWEFVKIKGGKELCLIHLPRIVFGIFISMD